jgi:hypothetical protein
MTSYMNWTQPLTPKQHMALMYLFERFLRDLDRWLALKKKLRR